MEKGTNLRNHGLGLGLLVAVSLLLHLAYLFSPLARMNFLPMDEGIYWDLAGHLSRDGRLALSGPAFATVGAGEQTLFWTPVYPILLSLALKLSPLVKASPLLILQLIQILLVACVPLLMYPIAGRFLKGKWLWLFLVFASLYPYTFQLATQVGSETTALFLSLAALSLACARARKSPLSLLLLGTLAAWLCLDRPEYLAFSLVLLAWVSFRLVRERGPEGGAALDSVSGGQGTARGLIVLCLSFSVWMGAWMYRNYQVTDGIAFTTRSGYSLAYQNEYYNLYSLGEVGSEEEWARAFPAFPTEMRRYAYLKGRARDFIRHHPLVYAQLCAKRLASFFLPQEAKGWIYHVLKRRDFKAVGIPAWFRFSNEVFLAGLWFLVLPASLRFLFRCLKRRRLPRSFWESPAGLLLLLILGQMAVYTFFAYIEYQRSILDLEILLLGFFFLAQDPLGSPVYPKPGPHSGPQNNPQKPQKNGE